MAAPQQPQPPQQPQGNPTMDASLLRRQLRDLLEDQGDYNNLLKNALSDLKKMDSAYGKIESRLNTLNKDSINVKEINRDISKLKQKEYIEQKKLSDLEKTFGSSVKNNLEIARSNTQQLMRDAAIMGEKIDYEETMLEYLKDQGDVEAIALYAAEKQLELAKKQKEEAEGQLAQEKLISKQMGVSGTLMKNLASKLGIGEEIYAAMTMEARNLVDENGKVVGSSNVIKAGFKAAGKELKTWWQSMSGFQKTLVVSAGLVKGISVAGKAAGAGLSKVGGALGGLTDTNVIQNATSGISSMLKNIPMVGGLLGGVVDMMSSFLDLSIGASSQVQKMGRELGLSKAESQALNNEFSDFADKSDNVLTTSKKLFETQIELGKSLGVMNVLSKERLETDIYLKEVAGLELDTRTSLAESSVILGKNQKDIMNSVFAQVKGLENATGIQLDQRAVLKEASSLGGYLGLSFAKYPAQLTKSLVSIKAMGMELKQLDSIADSFLDFESSISNEFEAQLLTGKEINLSKAREMFLNNDLAGAAGEITSQVGSASEFLSMNRIQAESMAKAFGMSRDQMGDMLKKQEYMSKIGAKDTDNAQKQYQLALAKYGTQKEMAAALGEETTQNMMNASAQEKIAGFMDKIKQSFVDLISNSGITKFIDKAIEWVSTPENIEAIVNKIQGFFHTVLQVTGSVIGGIMKFLDFLPGISIDSELIDTVSNLGDSFTSSPVGSLSGTKIASEKAATGRSAAAASAGGSQVVANVNMKTEYKPDPNNPAKMMYRIINEDTGQKSDWQTNVFGK